MDKERKANRSKGVCACGCVCRDSRERTREVGGGWDTTGTKHYRPKKASFMVSTAI